MAHEVPFVNLGAQYLSMREKILEHFDKISTRGAYILADEVVHFEKHLASYCQTPYALGVANATDALILVLKALGIGNGDEVITAPNSFIATAGAIAAVGGTPVFVDVKEDLNIDERQIEKRITKKTKAIIPVHLTGRPCAMDEIMAIAHKHKLAVIEDAAQAIGAKYKGRRVGSFGDAGCFSLHPLKNLGVHGDGGAITTNRKDLYEHLVKLRNHGLRNRDECDFWGYNSRLDTVQAAIADLKLNQLDIWTERILEIVTRYQKGLKDVVKVPMDKPGEESVYHNFVIFCERRDELMAYLLKEHGVETKIHYPIPIHLQKAARYLGHKRGDFPVTEHQMETMMSLPIYPELTDKQVEKVITGIRQFYGKK